MMSKQGNCAQMNPISLSLWLPVTPEQFYS